MESQWSRRLKSSRPTKRRLVSNSNSDDRLKVTLIVVAVGFVVAFVAGIIVGKNGMAAGSAGVAIAAAAARVKLGRIKKKSDQLVNASESIINDSVSSQADLESSAKLEAVKDENSARASLDTGDSAWERPRIFSDDS